MRLVAVHGINTNGQGNVDTLCNAVAKDTGVKVVNFDYPKISLLRANWALSYKYTHRTQIKHARELMEHTQDGDHVVAHSFGSAVVYACMHLFGRTFGHVWMIAPALDHAQASLGFENKYFESLTIVNNPYDRALKFGRELPWVDLSSIGLEGYNPIVEPNVANLPMPERFLLGDDSDWLNHSYAFKGQNLKTLTHIIADQVRS